MHADSKQSEFCMWLSANHSIVFRMKGWRMFGAQEEKLRIDEFTRFVEGHDPDAALVLSAFGEAASFVDARCNWCSDCRKVATTVEIQTGQHRGHNMGLGQNRFTRAKTNLKQLATKFMRLSQAADVAGPLETMSRTKTEATSDRRKNL